ncbi:MAG: M1 family metallopeptidase [Saprospiraceae bacterium]
MKNLKKKLFNLFLLLITCTLLSFCTEISTSSKPLNDLIEEKNGEIDVSFYHLSLDIDINSTYYSGKLICNFKPTESTQIVKLDLVNELKVSKVEFQNKDIEYSQIKDELIIDFSKNLVKNHLYSIIIYYGGYPQTISEANTTKGMVMAKHGNNEPVIATLSTPFLTHYWFPCHDDINDKADSIYIDIILPDTIINNRQLVAISNGELEANLVLSNKRRIFKWKHRYPIAPCYIFFAISNYQKHTETIFLRDNSELELDFYLFQEDFHASQESMSKMSEVAQFFVTKFGDYPFKKEQLAFAQIGFYSGIETQTCPIVENFTNRRFYTMVHEMAHAWFANSLTIEDWQHAWLHEGFATYAELLWDEYIRGKNAYHYSLLKKAYYQGGKIFAEPTDNPFQVFSGIVYNKGAYVLHMLRGIIGDDAFFDAIRTYLDVYQYQNVTTDDFISICEKKSGQDLDTFFDQWLKHEGHPIYNYTFSQNPRTNEISLSIRQSQMTEFDKIFEMPITILLDLEYKDTLITIINKSMKEQYTFNTNQKLLNVILDPKDYILKKIGVKKHILEISNSSIYEVNFEPSLSGRSIDITAKSAKQQKAEFILKDIDDNIVFEKSLRIGGTSKITIEIPRNVLGGQHTMIVESRYERYFSDLMILD